MRRVHPYLAIALVALALVLVTLAMAASAGNVGTSPTGPRGPVPGATGSMPQDGAFVYVADRACTGIGRTVPDLPTALCMRGKAIEYLIREVSERRVVPGPAFNACDSWAPWAFGSCIDWYVRRYTPEIRWGQSPVYVAGHVGGVPMTTCAAGVAYPDYVRVSLADESRIFRLVSWETANSILAYRLDLTTSADGPIVSAATSYAAAACGVN